MCSGREFVLALEADLHHPALSVDDSRSYSPEPHPLQAIPAFCSVEHPGPSPSCSSSEAPLFSLNMTSLVDDPFPPLVPASKSSNMPGSERVSDPLPPTLPQSPPPLWSSHFKQNSNQIPHSKPKSKLSFIEPVLRESGKVGVCPPLSSAGEIEDLKLAAVGFFMGHRPGFNFVKSALSKQWKAKGAVEFQLLMHGGFLFTFSEAEDRARILETGMFYVGGRPIFVREWERNIHSGAMGLKSLPLWITLPGLPLHLWSDEALSAVCSCLGKPLYADQTTQVKSRRAFARVCIDISAAEKMEHMIQVEDDEGISFVQPVVYEWTPPQCLECKIFGHDGKSCPQRPKVPSPSVVEASTVEDIPAEESEKRGGKESGKPGVDGFFRPSGKNSRRVRKTKYTNAGSGRVDWVCLEPVDKGNSNFKSAEPVPQDNLPPDPDSEMPESEPVPPVSPLISHSCLHATPIPTYLNPFEPIANLSVFNGEDSLHCLAERHPSPSKKKPEASKSKPLLTRSKTRAMRSESASLIKSPSKPLNHGPALNPLSISLRPSAASLNRARLPILPFSRLATLEPTHCPSLITALRPVGDPPLDPAPHAPPGVEPKVLNDEDSENWDSDSESHLSDEWGSLSKDYLSRTGRPGIEGANKVGSSKPLRVSPSPSEF